MILKYYINHAVIASMSLVLYITTIVLTVNNLKTIGKYLLITIPLLVNSLIQCIQSVDPFSQLDVYSTHFNKILTTICESLIYISVIELTIKINKYNIRKKILFRLSYVAHVCYIITVILTQSFGNFKVYFELYTMIYLIISLVISMHYINLIMIYHSILINNNLLNGIIVQYYNILIYSLVIKEVIELLSDQTIANWISRYITNLPNTTNLQNAHNLQNASNTANAHNVHNVSNTTNLQNAHNAYNVQNMMNLPNDTSYTDENSLSEGTSINTYTKENVEIQVPYDLHINVERSPVKVTFNI